LLRGLSIKPNLGLQKGLTQSVFLLHEINGLAFSGAQKCQKNRRYWEYIGHAAEMAHGALHWQEYIGLHLV